MPSADSPTKGTKTEAFLHALLNSKRENEELAAEQAALREAHRALESQLTTEKAALVKENAALKEQATHTSALAAEYRALESQLTTEKAALAKENAALKEQATHNSALAAEYSALESQLTTEKAALAKENAALKEQPLHASALAAVNEQLAAAQAALNKQATVNTALKKQAAENAAMNDQEAENAALASATVLKMKLSLQKIALKRQLTALTSRRWKRRRSRKRKINWREEGEGKRREGEETLSLEVAKWRHRLICIILMDERGITLWERQKVSKKHLNFQISLQKPTVFFVSFHLLRWMARHCWTILSIAAGE